MKISKVSYRMLRVHAQYENNAAEVEVVLGPKDTVEDAFKTAKDGCAKALGIPVPATKLPESCMACGQRLWFHTTTDFRCKVTGGAHVVSIKEGK